MNHPPAVVFYSNTKTDLPHLDKIEAADNPLISF